MTNIKFRAWDKLEKRMGEVNYIKYSKVQYTYVSARFKQKGKTVDEGFNYEGKEGYNNVILMQYTGIKDKNGTEIYEGDIIHWKTDISNKYFGDFKVEENVIVEWSKEELKWIFREKGANVFDEFKDLIGYDFEVIGNIYNDLKLLKEGE
jgi:uncharacterized phage protein (TIGR01671 family)